MYIYIYLKYIKTYCTSNPWETNHRDGPMGHKNTFEYLNNNRISEYFNIHFNTIIFSFALVLVL